MAQEDKSTSKQAILVFKPSGQVVEVEVGTLLSDAAVEAGISLNLPCGGQGRCGRCRVKVEHGAISHRSGVRLTSAEIDEGWALGCQAVVKGDAVVFVPEQHEAETKVIAPTVGAERIALAADFTDELDPSVRRAHVIISPPSLDDQTTDWDRLLRELSLQHGVSNVTASLPMLRTLGRDLREAEWNTTAVLEMGDPQLNSCAQPRLIDLLPGDQTDRCYGVAIDIGTTSIFRLQFTEPVAHLVDRRRIESRYCKYSRKRIDIVGNGSSPH